MFSTGIDDDGVDDTNEGGEDAGDMFDREVRLRVAKEVHFGANVRGLSLQKSILMHEL